VNVAARRRVETGEESEKGGLAGARSSHNGDELTGGNGEVDAFEDVDCAGAVADGLAEIVDEDHRLVRARLGR